MWKWGSKQCTDIYIKVVVVTSLEILKDLNLSCERKFHFAKTGLRSPGEQVGPEPAMCSCGKGGAQHAGLH